MKTTWLVSLAAMLLAPATPLAVLRAGEPAKPNIVFILADDLGWSDTTLYGTTKFYETPNIERLAQRGMTFRNAYAANPLCSPTRASIMTGLYPARIGITTPVLPRAGGAARRADGGQSPAVSSCVADDQRIAVENGVLHACQGLP